MHSLALVAPLAEVVCPAAQVLHAWLPADDLYLPTRQKLQTQIDGLRYLPGGQESQSPPWAIWFEHCKSLVLSQFPTSWQYVQPSMTPATRSDAATHDSHLLRDADPSKLSHGMEISSQSLSRLEPTSDVCPSGQSIHDVAPA